MAVCEPIPPQVQSSTAQLAPIGSSAVELRIIRTITEIESIRTNWVSWKGHRDSDIDFFLELVQSSEKVIRPHIVVLYRKGRIDAILVGRLEEARMDFKIGYFRLPSATVRELIFSYGGFRGNTSDENGAAMIRCILESLDKREADLAMLHQASTESTLYEKALQLPGFLVRDHLAKPDTRHFMTLPNDVDQLYRGFSQGLRAEIRRKRRKLEADFGSRLTVRRVRNTRELDAIFPDLEEIAKKTYQRGIGVGFIDSPEIRRRFRFCAEKGWLRIYVVYIDEIPSSFWSGTVSDASFVSDDVGYDPKFREYSLGTFVLTSLLEDLCREGVTEVDFGPGQAEYKQRFGNRRTNEASLLIFAPGIRGMVLNSLRSITKFTDSAAKTVLERTNLLPRVKRFLRNRAATQDPALSATPRSKQN